MTSVFGRFAGRKHATAQFPGQQERGHATDLSLPLDVQSAVDERSGADARAHKLLPNAHHRRESSILSLTASVTDLGSTVRRSVSSRSHRTHFSGSVGSVGSAFGHKNRSPSSSNNLFSPLAGSPIESLEETQAPQLPPGPPPPIPDTSPNPLRPSLKKSLSQKFKNHSTDTLKTTLTSPLPPPSRDGKLKSPRPATDQLRPQLTPMLTGSALNPPLPLLRPPERPTTHTQSSFSSATRDIYSSHGGGSGNGAPLRDTLTAASVAGNYNPNAIYQQIQETSAKRMATMDYLRQLHEGDVFYFSALHYSQASLSAMPSLYPHKLARRATGYFVLGYSLPTLLDMNANTPMEYLKALSSLLAEFETYQTLMGFDSSGSTIRGGRMGAMLKSGMNLGNRANKGRRSSGTADSIGMDARQSDSLSLPKSAGTDAGSPQDSLPSPINLSGHDFTHLLTPHLPFDPDFNTTFSTLCDTLIDAYGKLMDLVSGPEACGPGLGDAFAKADKAIRKILVANVVREFEETTRAGVKQEVAGLGKLVLGGLM